MRAHPAVRQESKLAPRETTRPMKNKKSPPKPTAHGNKMPVAEQAQTIAHTVAEHQNDPGHHFHARGKPWDSRTSVAAGERLQRVRGRAQAN